MQFYISDELCVTFACLSESRAWNCTQTKFKTHFHQSFISIEYILSQIDLNTVGVDFTLLKLV
uniref:Uncharacterized protein n=1 Tax=Anguilla anguilla TaxID=7936 RepID=A0A0E9W9Q0_ANGAN